MLGLERIAAANRADDGVLTAHRFGQGFGAGNGVTDHDELSRMFSRDLRSIAGDTRHVVPCLERLTDDLLPGLAGGAEDQ